MATLTEQEFSQHLNTIFRVKLDTPQPIDLKLVEVKGYAKKAEEASGMERFSLYFDGPADVMLEQHLYPLKHDAMGELEIFLVPIAKTADGFRYEAVFNYYVK
jgi:hypothetical protein